MTDKRKGPSKEELQPRLARHLLQLQEGSRVAGIRKLAARNRTSVGSVFNALAAIEKAGAVRIVRRGRLGSFVEANSLGKLWGIAEKGPLVIAHTLPSTPRFEGLATALKHLLAKAGVEAYMIFIRGSRTRLKALREGRCHLALMSCFAADKLCGENEDIVLRLPGKSWVAGHSLWKRVDAGEVQRKLRVAVDRDSFDHFGLTELEFGGKDVELVPVTYAQLHRHLAEGYVDVAVWTDDEIEGHPNPRLVAIPMSENAENSVGESQSMAAIVARAGDVSVRSVVKASLRIEEILAIQQIVVARHMVPEY